MATQMSKSQLVEKIATTTELSKRDVKNVMDTLTDVGHKELKKAGVFLLPGWAKFVVVKKPAPASPFVKSNHAVIASNIGLEIYG